MTTIDGNLEVHTHNGFTLADALFVIRSFWPDAVVEYETDYECWVYADEAARAAARANQTPVRMIYLLHLGHITSVAAERPVTEELSAILKAIPKGPFSKPVDPVPTS